MLIVWLCVRPFIRTPMVSCRLINIISWPAVDKNLLFSRAVGVLTVSNVTRPSLAGLLVGISPISRLLSSFAEGEREKKKFSMMSVCQPYGQVGRYQNYISSKPLFTSTRRLFVFARIWTQSSGVISSTEHHSVKRPKLMRRMLGNMFFKIMLVFAII